MRKINCLLIEDEVPSQKILIDYIGRLPHLELKGVFNNPLDAIELIQNQAVELLFLDISLPHMSGTEFLRSFKMMPKVIITSGSDEFALESYEFEVLDYLLKPFSFSRFLTAVSRFAPASSDGVEGGIKTTKGDFLFVKDGKEQIKIVIEEILYIGAEKDYSKVVTKDKNYLILKPMNQWESDLPDQLFARTHKSYIVNLMHVDRMQGNQLTIGEEKIPIGRNYKIGFQKVIKKYNL